MCIAQKQEKEVARPPFFTYFRGAWKKNQFPRTALADPEQNKIELDRRRNLSTPSSQYILLSTHKSIYLEDPSNQNDQAH
jgi:hypothetical protein